jgi:hypothetical protein
MSACGTDVPEGLCGLKVLPSRIFQRLGEHFLRLSSTILIAIEARMPLDHKWRLMPPAE